MDACFSDMDIRQREMLGGMPRSCSIHDFVPTDFLVLEVIATAIP